jgi:hypothetical protein
MLSSFRRTPQTTVPAWKLHEAFREPRLGAQRRVWLSAEEDAKESAAAADLSRRAGSFRALRWPWRNPSESRNAATSQRAYLTNRAPRCVPPYRPEKNRCGSAKVRIRKTRG